MFRKSILVLHRYLGLICAIPLILLGLSGAAIAFEAELDRALNRSYWSVPPADARLGAQRLVDAVKAAHPNDPPTMFRFSPAPDVAAEVFLKGGLLVSVDPHTGRVVGSRRREQILMSKIHQFHTRLLLGEWGERITGWSTVMFLVLSVSGLVLWWRRKGFVIQWRVPWRRFHYDVHHAIGIYALVPALVLGITAVAMSFAFITPAIFAMTRSHPAPQPGPLKSQPGNARQPMDADAAAAACNAALPGAQIVMLGLPTSRTGTYQAFMRFPEDHTPGGRSRVVLDGYSGKLLWMENSRTAPAGTRILNLNRPIHTGDIFGWPTRVIACLASIALAIQCISGVFLWRPEWGRRRITT